jgi:hypothetical protein
LAQPGNTPRRRAVAIRQSTGRQSTACVDNFVGNRVAPTAKPRKRWAGDGLLKS